MNRMIVIYHANYYLFCRTQGTLPEAQRTLSTAAAAAQHICSSCCSGINLEN
jgi:hypothetical protein